MFIGKAMYGLVGFILCYILTFCSKQVMDEKSSVRTIELVASQSGAKTYNQGSANLNILVDQGIKNIIVDNNMFITKDLIIPYGYSLVVLNGNSITSNKPIKLEIYGEFRAGNTNIFHKNIEVLFGAGSTERVNVMWFGAKADGYFNQTSEYLGSDDTEAIQKAINSAEFVRNVFLPAYKPATFPWFGAYEITKTLQVTGRKNFSSISLRGEESYDQPRSIIYAHHTEGGAVNIQSTRGAEVSYLGIIGKNKFNYNFSKKIADYQDKGIETNKLTAYSGITIDADTTRPGSANTIIKNCKIQKFYVGINVSAGGQTQGDMLTVEKCALEFNAIHITIGNSQARSITVTRCDIRMGHTVLDNITMGAQLGSTINFTHNQISNCYQLFNYATSAGGPTDMSGNYAENLGRFGVVLGGNNQNTLTIRDGTYKFVPNRFKAGNILDGQSNFVVNSCLLQFGDIKTIRFSNSKRTKFENSRIRSLIDMPEFVGTDIVFENCIFKNKWGAEKAMESDGYNIE